MAFVASESLRLLASSKLPVDLARSVRRENDYGATGSAQDDRIDYVSVGRIGPSADSLDDPRASTKGRVEARSHIEKIDRIDLANEFVTR